MRRKCGFTCASPYENVAHDWVPKAGSMIGGSQVRSLSRPPPSLQVSNSARHTRICPAERGLFESALVSESVSTRRKCVFYPSVSASKNSVPDSDVRDRFDDWVGGWQFGPFQLHHPVCRYRTPPETRAFVPRNAGFSSSPSSPYPSPRDEKAVFARLSLHPKIPFPAAGAATVQYPWAARESWEL
jgi:hypothetical protein